MAERWKPLPASSYKEDFRLRKPILPPTYKTESSGAAHDRNIRLLGSRAKFTNAAKVLWPQEGYTKADTIAYYDAIAATMLPHLRSRPLIMERYPNGIAQAYFLQKDALPDHTPDWMLPFIHEVYAPEAKRNVRYICADDRDVLMYL